MTIVVFLAGCQRQDPAPGQAGGNDHSGGLGHFVLTDFDGKEVASREFTGKILVVDFWATWCQPCIKEIPEYNALQKKHGGKFFQMVGITVDSGDLQSVKPFISRYGIEYPVYMGNEEVKAYFGGIIVYPTTFVVDQDGKILRKYMGSRPGKAREIEDLIKKLQQQS